MEERIRGMEHKGKTVALLDLSGLSPKEILALIPKFDEFVIGMECRRVLVDISSTYPNTEIKEAVAASGRNLAERLGKVSVALVGVRGGQRVLANAASPGQYFASTREDALEHLARG